MCPACAKPPSANSPGVARREPSFRAARLLDCARLRPLRARRVATPAGHAERDQVRLPTSGQGTEPDFGQADRRQTARHLMHTPRVPRRSSLGSRSWNRIAGVSGSNRGQDLNLRPSGYERDFTQPADGRRYSCFQFLRVVRRSGKSTEVHTGIRKSPRVWTRSGQSLRGPSQPATFALAGRRSSYSFHAGASLSGYPVHLHDHLELILERQPCELAAVRDLRCRDAIDRVFRTQAFSGAFRGTFSSGLRAHGP